MRKSILSLLVSLCSLFTSFAAEIGIQPSAGCPDVGFGWDFYDFGAQFRVTQPIRIHHLCGLRVIPSDTVSASVNLWKLSSTPVLLRSVGVGDAEPFGSYCFAGSTNIAYFRTGSVSPIVLLPGDYAVVQHRPPENRQWWVNTLAFMTGPGVQFLGPTSADPQYLSGDATAAVFGPSFLYDLLPPQPLLEFAQFNDQLQLSWSQQTTNAILQVSTNLTSPIAWDNLSTVALTNETHYFVTVPMTNSATYFRLVLPD